MAAALGVSALVLTELAHVNPLLAYEQKSGGFNAFPILMTNAQMRSWHQGKLISSAKFRKIQVREDFSEIRANDISDGVYWLGKDRLNYTAAVGDYDVRQGTLAANGLCQVGGRDFSLQSQGFFFKESNHLLNVPYPVTGTLAKGKLVANNVTFSLASHELTTGPLQWQGALSLAEAQGQGSAKTGQNSGGDSDTSKPHPWTFKAEGSRSGTVNGRSVRIFFKAEASDGRIVVKSPEISQDVKTDVLTCKGPVLYYSAKVDLTCDQAVVQRRQKEAILSGHVVMYVKPKDAEVLNPADPIPPFKPLTPDEVDKQRPPKPMVMDAAGKPLDDELRSKDSVRKYPATVFADKIDYFYADGSRHGVITGSPQAQQELPGGRWRMIWADQGYYDGEANTLRLTGQPKAQTVLVKDSLGDNFSTTSFTGSTEEGNDTYEAGPSSGVYYTDDDQLNKAADQAGAKDKDSQGKGSKESSGKDKSGMDKSGMDKSGMDKSQGSGSGAGSAGSGSSGTGSAGSGGKTGGSGN